MACRSPLNAHVHAEYKHIREEFSKKLKRRRRDFVKGKALAEIIGYEELDREDTTEISARSFADMLKAHMSSPQPPMESADTALRTPEHHSLRFNRHQWKP